MPLTGFRRELCESSPFDFTDLRAPYVNCTLEPSPQVSHTQGLIRGWWRAAVAGGMPACAGSKLYSLEHPPAVRKLRSGVVELAGFEVADELILELASLLQRAGYDETAERLTYALKWGDELVGLRIADRLAILDVLDDAPEAFADLRGVLTSEHRWRIRHGLV